MAEREQDDEYAAFERELELVLALEPTERIRRYAEIAERLHKELDTAEGH